MATTSLSYRQPPVLLNALPVLHREGGRDLDTMLEFAEDRLGPYCSASAMHACTRPQKKTLKKFLKMSDEERESLVAESDNEIAEIEAKAKEEGDAVQEQIKQLTDEHKVRLGRLECVRAVRRSTAIVKASAGLDSV